MIHTGFLARTFKSIAACFLLKTCLELLSLRNDKFYSFEETITGDYGNQTEIYIHWTEIHIHHKKQLGSPQINVLERIMLVELSSNIVKLLFLSDLQSIVRKYLFLSLTFIYSFCFSNYLSKQIFCLWEFSLTDAISLSKSLFINISPFGIQHFNCPCIWNTSHVPACKLISFYLFWTLKKYSNQRVSADFKNILKFKWVFMII